MITTQFTQEDADLLAELGVITVSPENDLTILRNVKPRSQVRVEERNKPDFVAHREVCKDFGLFKPLFEQIQGHLESKTIPTIPYNNSKSIRKYGCYIVYGQKAFIAEFGDWFKSNSGAKDARLRVVFDNGTECSLLFQSFKKAMVADKTSRVIS